MEQNTSSNLAHWISCFPRYSAFFANRRNIEFFTLNAPPDADGTVISQEWKQITESLTDSTPE